MFYKSNTIIDVSGSDDDELGVDESEIIECIS